MQQAALQLIHDLHNRYPMHGESHFAELHEFIEQFVQRSAPTTEAELHTRLITLGEITLAAYRVRERIELGTVM
jgi:hypothetical protein